MPAQKLTELTLATPGASDIVYGVVSPFGSTDSRKFTVSGVVNAILGASPTLVTPILGVAAYTSLAGGVITLTSTSAAAFESGPNGGTNPTLRLVQNVSSAITGLSITGNATGAGVTLTALGGTNEDIKLVAKGAGSVIVNGATANNSFGLIVKGGTNNNNEGIRVYAANLSQNVDLGFAALSTSNASFQIAAGSTRLQLAVNSNNVAWFDSSGNTALGFGTGDPTYGIHYAATSGVTLNQTMLVQDATPTTGVTGIFFNAGAAQSTTPILTVGGILRATKFNVNGTAGANFSGAVTNITVVDGIVTAAS